MAYKVTMQKSAAQEAAIREGAIQELSKSSEPSASKVTIKEARTKLARMNLSDQFLFDEVMEYQDAFEAAVIILTGREVRLLGKAETEKEFRISPELRKSRLDSVAMDESRRVYTMEMQKRNTKNLRRRSRLYQGHVDVSMMAPGTVDFNSLKDVCQIMVTPFDIFGRRLYRYTFVSMCVECPDLYLGGGAWRIFINTKGKNPQEFTQEFLDFMKYITRSTDARAEATESERIKTIHKRVKEVKKSEVTNMRLVKRWEELDLERAEAREKGWKEGREEGRAEGKAVDRAEGKAVGRAEGKAVGRAEGKAEGKADSILMLLEDLGEVPEDLAVRVREQKEDSVLCRWLKLAARAAGLEEFRKEINASGGKMAG